MRRLKLNPVNNAKGVLHIGKRAKLVVTKRLSVKRKYIFSIDSPRKSTIEKHTILVEGWIISKKLHPFELRVKNNEKIYTVKTGLKRLDVAKTHPNIPEEYSLYSGFSKEFEFEDGDVTIEISAGKGFKKLYGKKVHFSIENLPSSIYNKDLSNNYPEHINLLENRKSFYYEGTHEGNFSRDKTDSRVVAIYLPQFHPIEANDENWGKGFTEWTNVTAAQPRFIGHQQPILPSDLGYYDLRLETNIKAQINLAKSHGLYGFCFYYYWFSGKRLLEKPLASFLKHKEWDFNFSICWANENWTKRWDGRDSDVIIAQEYLEDDPIHFIKDVEHILLDTRYISEDGKPVLMVYRASELKNPEEYAKVWREYFRKKHGKELQLVSYLSFDDQDPREYGFDAALDFAPLSAFFKNKLFEDNQFPYIDMSHKLLDINFSGVVADYRSIALNGWLDDAYVFPTYPCVTPSWDNDARKKGKGFVYQNSSPDLYANWLERVVSKQVASNEPLLFINAWNEWAEGAMMEPSTHLGHAILNRTAEVLSKHSANKTNEKEFPMYGIRRNPNKKLAVVVHLYYTDLWPAISNRLSKITEPFDLFVTINERDKEFEPVFSNKETAVHAFVLPNRGRDVLPFLFVLRRIQAAGYEYVLKLHSKKSKHRKDGFNWFSDVVDNLLPNASVISDAIDLLANGTSMIGPAGHLVSLKRHMGSNKHILENLLSRAYDKETAQEVTTHPEFFPYFGGTMFWARVDTLKLVMDLYLMPDDFQSEHGQVDGTTAHALERMFGVVAWLRGNKIYQLSEQGPMELIQKKYDEKYTHAP